MATLPPSLMSSSSVAPAVHPASSGHPVIIVADAVVLCYLPMSLSLSHWCPFVRSLSSPFSCSSHPIIVVSHSLTSPSTWSPLLPSASSSGPWWWLEGITIVWWCCRSLAVLSLLPVPTPRAVARGSSWSCCGGGGGGGGIVKCGFVISASLCHCNTVESPRLMKTYVN